MDNHLISVIVPVYKVEPYLRKCVDSILNQTYRNLEVILVDDGSPDKCGEICDEYAARDPRVKVIHKANGGLSDARNAGLDICKGRYIAFVDSDDWIEPEMYQRLYELLVRFNADMSVGGVADDIEENGRTYTSQKSNYGQEPFSESNVEAMKRFFENSWASWDKLYRRELFDNIRFPVGEINEDEAIVLHLLDRCKTVCYTSELFYHYMKRINSGSITMAPFSPSDLAWKKNCAFNLSYIRSKYPDLEPFAAKRYRSSLMWHITKLSIMDDCSMYQSEINQIMKELRSEKKVFDIIPMDSFKSRIQYMIAVYFGFKCYRTIFRIKRGKPL